MSSKAAIITFHCVPNYGAALQAYALQTKLEELYDEVAIIDYCPERITKEYNAISWYSLPAVVTTLWSAVPFLRKVKKFSSFRRQYLHLTECRHESERIETDFDADVVFLGSDQIWNPQITGGFDPVYFGNITFPKPCTVASYAASIGKTGFNNDEKTEFGELFQKLDFLSVRESYLQKILSKEFHRTADIAADPTILAGQEAFLPLIKPVDSENYLLFYSLTGMPEAFAMAEKIARYFNLTLLELSGRRKPLLLPKHKVIYDAGPEDFVSLFSKASYVVTDSFHGTVFSLLFHVPFISLANPERGGRITDLLDAVELRDRSILHFDRNAVCTDVDWVKADANLELVRIASMEYLKRVGRGIQ